MTENQTKKRSRFLLHPYFISTAVVLLLIAVLIWSMGNIINAKALRKSLEDNISYQIGADVTISELKTELSLRGTWKIRLRDITVSNTSPDFGPDFFVCRKLVFEGSAFDLLAGKWKPKILFKDWSLTVGAAEKGRTNISDLFQPRGSAPPVWDGWPFSNIFSGKQKILLQNGKILVKKAFTEEKVFTFENLNGSGLYTPLSQNEFNGNFNFQLKNIINKNNFSLTLDINEMKFVNNKITGLWESGVKLSNINIARLAMLSNIPGTSKTGRIEQANFKFNGTLDNRSKMNIKFIDASFEKCKIPVFNIEGKTRIIAEKFNEKELLKWKISLQDNKNNSIHKAVLSESESLRSLAINSPYIDFTKLSSIPDPESWEQFILKNVSSISAQAKRYIIFGLVIDNAKVEFKLQGKTLKSKKLTGSFAGGEARLDVKNWIMGGKGWPQEIGFIINNADGPKLFSTAAHIIPSATIPPPLEGKLSLALLSPAEKRIAEKINLDRKFDKLLLAENRGNLPAIKVALIIDSAICFDTPGESALFKSLWNFFPDLKNLEKRLSEKSDSGSAKPLNSLNLKSGSLVHTTIPGSLTFSTEGIFTSSELGTISIKQKVDSLSKVINSVIKLKPLKNKSLKNSEIELPQFSEKFSRITERVESSTGLNLILSSNGRKVEKLYLKDIINRWQKMYPSTKGRQK